MQAEMANKITNLYNYRAWCRLIYDPRSREEDNDTIPRIEQHYFNTEILNNERTEQKKQEMANRIRKNSRTLAKPYKLVKREVEKRMVSDIMGIKEIPTAEVLKE
jgi:hypothetical protein